MRAKMTMIKQAILWVPGRVSSEGFYKSQQLENVKCQLHKKDIRQTNSFS